MAGIGTPSPPHVVIGFKLRKCIHSPEINAINSFPGHWTVGNLYEDIHKQASKAKGTAFEACGFKDIMSVGITFNIGGTLTLSSVKEMGINYIVFTCNDNDVDVEVGLKNVVEKTTRKTVDAFQLLMAGGRAYPEFKRNSSGIREGLSRKDELFNDIIEHFFVGRKCDFPRSMAASEGSYITQVLCNCLWYITNQHLTINETSDRYKEVMPVPTIFERFQGYNEVKRKKTKSLPLDCQGLKSHSQALYSLLMKPIMNSSCVWKSVAEELKELADCLEAYSRYLEKKKEAVQENQSLLHPVRTIAADATIEFRGAVKGTVNEKYKMLDEKIANLDILEPVLFDEKIHCSSLFCTNMQRYRFIKKLRLSVPIYLIRFSPGGSTVSTLCIVRVVHDVESVPNSLVEGARILQTCRPILKEYHTRAQRTQFKDKLNNIAKLSPALLEFIYKELAMENSVASHPATQERLRLISLGNTSLIADLRHLNPGRPGNKYDTYFGVMGNIIEEITAADERRHGEAHLSEFLSLEDLMQKTKERCADPETPTPSKSLVRLQFAPRNPYCHAALNFTSKINVQYKIQKRQLRNFHMDAHFCNAQFKYLKLRAIELQDKVVLLCSDDKAKVPFGEPGVAVSTAVRGKKSIVPTATSLVAMDHDMKKGSLTPSVNLLCEIPSSIDMSFVRGKVFTAVNDSVLQSANPFRHAAFTAKVLANREERKPILLKYTDGGTDQRNNLESVRCANICLFREMNLDMLIHVRCAPGHSWTNPAERIMSILNIGLQNVSLERKEAGREIEMLLKGCNSMSNIREKCSSNATLCEGWTQSVEPLQSLVSSRFRRLKLKSEPIQVVDPCSLDDIDLVKRHLRELFPELNLQKLQKSHTQKVEAYKAWIEKHCKASHYVFQIRKCQDRACCLEPVVSEDDMKWLPDPVLGESGEHVKAYEEVNGTETSENDRPSLKEPTKKKALTKKTEKTCCPAVRPNTEETEAQPVTENVSKLNDMQVPKSSDDPGLCTVQNSRSLVSCVECSKPRVIYSRHRLTERQQTSVVIGLSEYDYTCGSMLLPPENPMFKNIMSRTDITCQSPVELQYYSSGLGLADLCAHCGLNSGQVSTDLLKRYKTVLPLCDECKDSGKSVIVQRPYGKN